MLVLVLVVALGASAAVPPGHSIGHRGSAQGDSAFASAWASVGRPARLWLRVQGRVESVLGGVVCYQNGSDPSKKPILKFAPGLYELPVPRYANRCNVFADANGSGHVSVEFRAVTAARTALRARR